MSINKVILIGNLGADPEIRNTTQGTQLASFRVVTSDRWRDKRSGEMQEKVEWHNVVIYNDNLVTVAEKYLKKGSKVYLEGKLQTRKWEDKDQVTRYTTEIVLGPFNSQLEMLGKKDEEDIAPSRGRDTVDKRPAPGKGSPAKGAASKGVARPGRAQRDEMDDDIPF